MTSLLIATGNAILRHDLMGFKSYLDENSRPGYYGISWFNNASRPCLTHSVFRRDLASASEYMRSEIGYLSFGQAESRRFLSNPHQIRCLDYPFVAATNTGRNAIEIINCTDWSVRQIRFDDVLWDRYDPSGTTGSHFNSIDFDGKALHVLAHNFDKGAFELVLDWPSLKVIRRVDHAARQLHNIWVLPDGRRLSCNSPEGSLIDLSTDGPVWSSGNRNSYTRGIAAAGGYIFIGGSEVRARADRELGRPTIWVVERETLKTVDRIELNWYGGVNEIRVLDDVDECHSVGPLTIDEYLFGEDVEPHIPALEKYYRDLLGERNPTDPNDPAPHRPALTALEETALERDKALTERDEAWAQHKRVVEERAAMMVERDKAWTDRDEAYAQYRRLSEEHDRALKVLYEARRGLFKFTSSGLKTATGEWHEALRMSLRTSSIVSWLRKIAQILGRR